MPRKKMCKLCKQVDISDRPPMTKYCLPCGSNRVYQYRDRMTPSQKQKALELAGTMYINEMARVLGVSLKNLSRFKKDHPDKDWRFGKWKVKTDE